MISAGFSVKVRQCGVIPCFTLLAVGVATPYFNQQMAGKRLGY